MKPIRFSRILGQSKTLRSCRLALLAPAIVITLSAAQAAQPAKPAPAPAAEQPASNWITFTVGGAFVSDNDAGFMRRAQTNGDFYGGVESFQLTKAIDKSTSLTLDGRAIPGLEDYEFGFLLKKEEVGYIKAGYKAFRTWYDGSGGFYPGAPMVAPVNEEMSIDRAEITFEAGLRMENLPEITFSYKHSTRDGMKDSLAWAEAAVAPGNQKVVPAYFTIDEKSDLFELEVEHTVGNTDLGLGLVYEHIGYTDSRYTPRWTSVSNTVPLRTGFNGVTLTDSNRTDIMGGNISSVTRFNDKVWVTFGASYNTLDSDLDGGSRSYNPYVIRGARDYQYQDTLGGSQEKQLIANLNLMLAPVDGLTITPSARYEHENVHTWSGFNAYSPLDIDSQVPLVGATALNFTSGAPFLDAPFDPAGLAAFIAGASKAERVAALGYTWRGPQAYGREGEMDSAAAALDLRYTGVSDWVFYAKALVGHEDEYVHITSLMKPGEYLASDIEVDERKAIVGANWYATNSLSFALQGSHEEREQELNHTGGDYTTSTDPAAFSPALQAFLALPTAARAAALAGLPDADINAALTALAAGGTANNIRPIMAKHVTETDTFGVRASWKPVSNVSLVTRYDYRQTEYRNAGIQLSPPAAAVTFAEIQSSQVVSHALSECITWNPMARLYVQGTASYVLSETETQVSAIVADSENNYFVGSLTLGYAIDDQTDINATYSYLSARDYSQSPASMGYGVNTKENSIGVGLTRMINPNMVWNLRYTYMSSNTDPKTDQSGGFNDFNAHMVSTGLQIRF